MACDEYILIRLTAISLPNLSFFFPWVHPELQLCLELGVWGGGGGKRGREKNGYVGSMRYAAYIDYLIEGRRKDS